MAARARQGFARFALPDGTGLCDVIDGPDGADTRLRPNQIFAVSLWASPLDAAAQLAVRSVLVSGGVAANRELRASVNQGKPSIAATGRPGEFSGHEVMGAREAGAPYHPPANQGENARPESGFRPPEGGSRPAIHPNDLPKFRPFTPPNTGNANLDRKYQQQQDKLFAKQEQQRQNLQQKQEQEHQRAEQRSYSQPQRNQMEQRHQQQTQQLQQKHEQQQQHLQTKQQRHR
jgi:hypothetical protein